MKKKNQAGIGTVLRKIADPNTLKPWADLFATVDPWLRLQITSETLMQRWAVVESKWSFYAAVKPKDPVDFDHELGLVVFTSDGGRAVVEKILKNSIAPELGDGGYVQLLGTKNRHKGVGKYLLGAAERIVSDKHKRMFLFVSELNTSAQRFYKGQGYEEIGRVQDCLQVGNTEILMTKKLE